MTEPSDPSSPPSREGDDPFHHLHDEGYERIYAQRRVDASQLIAIAGRTVESLDGEWDFVLDLFDEGLRQRWYAEVPTAIATWRTPRDYDGGAWQRVATPSSWNVLKPEWFHFEGAAWYGRTLRVERLAPGERLVLYVGAANYEARVFLNGGFAGAHRGGSTPFCVELTDFVQDGENRLLIQVDNRRRADRVPMHHIDWFNYGGLYRSVSLLRLPPVFIRHFSLALAADPSCCTLRLEVELSGPVDEVAELTVAGLGGPWRIAVQGGRGTAEIGAAPELWSPDHPVLYEVSLTCAGDRLHERIGFRRIEVRGERILLNGQDLFLRGICVHEDDRDTGKTTGEADLRRRFTDARALGCNFLRLSHYPHDALAASIADEMGLLLWSEIPVYWAIDFANPDTYADAGNQLTELIRRDINRCSVIIWGVGNENADTDARLAFMSGLARMARRLDPTRLISAACLINRERFTIEDRLAEHLDVVGLNEYFGWYEPSFDGLTRLLAQSAPGKPVVVTETGADAKAGRSGPETELFTEECQAAVYRAQLALLATAPYVRGICPWILYDFRTERRQTALQRGWNLKGLIAADKTTRKQAFDVLAAHYHAMAAQSGPNQPAR